MRRLLLALAAAGACMTVSAPAASAGHRFPPLPVPQLPAGPAPDLPFAEAGRDAPPTPPSACQTQPAGNPFAVPLLSVDAIAGDAVNVGRGSNHGCVTPQNEPALAVNPTDPANVVIAANDYRLCCDSLLHNDGGGLAYTSTDSGRSFKQVLAPGFTSETGGTAFFAHVDSAGDPSLAFSRDGTLYYANMAFSRSSPLNGLGVSVSRDGGRSFSRPHLVAATADPRFFIDKPAMTVGPAGTVYITFTLFIADSNGQYVASPILMASSRDTVHWRYRIVTDGMHPYNQGSTPQVSPAGRVFVSFESGTFFGDQAVVAALRNGRFQNTDVAAVNDSAGCYPSNDDDRESLTGESYRINSFPAFAIDAATGRQVLVWADNPSCEQPTRNEVSVVFGNPSGSRYSKPYQLPGEGDRSFPAVAARDGKVAVSYYTRAYATDGVSLDYAVQFPLVGPAETRLSEQSSDPSLQFDGSFIGDYTALAYGPDGVVHAAWTDFRGLPGVTAPNQDIYTRTVG